MRPQWRIAHLTRVQLLARLSLDSQAFMEDGTLDRSVVGQLVALTIMEDSTLHR